MTRIRNELVTGVEAGIRARIRARIPAFVLMTLAISSSAAVVVACGDADPAAPAVDPPDAASDGHEASLPPVDDAGVQDEVDADAARPAYDASDEPVACTTTPCVTQLAAGDRHFCALLSDGTVQCWGTDTRGSLGRSQLDGGNDAGTSPQPVVGITNATQISAGAQGNTTCVRDAEGFVQCWGDNSGAQLGLQESPALRDSVPHPTPTRVALVSQVARVDVGQANACAITHGGQVYCWGGNVSQQLARPGSSGFYAGAGLAELGTYEIARITLAQYSSFAVTKDGELLGWGRASGRQSSLSGNEGSPTPVPLPSMSDVTRAATSGASGSNGHQCTIAAASVYCWGSNTRGELGTGVPDNEQLPAFAGIITDAGVFPQQLALAPNRTCVRMTNGTLQCCGDDRLGQLGRGGDAGTFSSRFVPATAFVEHAVQVAASTNATCALVQGGTVMCWGGNANGELGQGAADNDPHPTPVPVVFQ